MADQTPTTVLASHCNSAERHPNQNGLEAKDIYPYENRDLGRDNSRASVTPKHKSTRFMQNPLRRFSPEELDVDVDMFLGRNRKLEDLRELLRQGAQIARDPFAPQAVKHLSTDDKKALRDENERPFRYPLKYWFTIGVCCCAAALQGWSQVGIVPGNIAWPQEFGVDKDSKNGKCGVKSAE